MFSKIGFDFSLELDSVGFEVADVAEGFSGLVLLDGVFGDVVEGDCPLVIESFTVYSVQWDWR